MNRRDFVIKGALVASLPIALANAQAPSKESAKRPKFDAKTGEIHWLAGSAPAAKTGATFGLPWPQGSLQKSEALTLRDGAGQSVPLQTWHTAFWPDGSIS